MSILGRLYKYKDCRSKRVFKESKGKQLRRWVWYNTPYFIVLGAIVFWIILLFLFIRFGSCQDSGQEYNHLKDCIEWIIWYCI
jgi:hypothetical protein